MEGLLRRPETGRSGARHECDKPRKRRPRGLGVDVAERGELGGGLLDDYQRGFCTGSGLRVLARLRRDLRHPGFGVTAGIVSGVMLTGFALRR